MFEHKPKTYPVWQLTDGTIVIQGQPAKLEEKLVVKQPKLTRRMRHWLLKTAEKL